MEKTWIVALSLTVVTSSNVSATPHGERVFSAALLATLAPRAEVERIAALLERDHAPEPAIEIAARWTREAAYAPAALVGDRVVWAESNQLHAISLRDGSPVHEADAADC